jgi:hypothetical protein
MVTWQLSWRINDVVTPMMNDVVTPMINDVVTPMMNDVLLNLSIHMPRVPCPHTAYTQSERSR